MDNRNRPFEENSTGGSQPSPSEGVKNPFENSEPAEQHIDQAKEDIEKEQQFKEALTERD